MTYITGQYVGVWGGEGEVAELCDKRPPSMSGLTWRRITCQQIDIRQR